VLTAVCTYGGVERWAARMGVEKRPPRRRVPPPCWTDERIASELAAFSAERVQWPTARDFEAAGLMRLYWAASRRGGMRYWERQLGSSSERGRDDVAA
jgi:hypothetical protein